MASPYLAGKQKADNPDEPEPNTVDEGEDRDVLDVGYWLTKISPPSGENMIQEPDPVCKDWLQNIRVTRGENIGSAFARYIHRDRAEGFFLRDAAKLSKEMVDLVFGVFSQYGCLSRYFINHSVGRGTGVWGDELDVGPLLFLAKIHVSHEATGGDYLRGLMFSEIFERAQRLAQGQTSHVTTEATYTLEDIEHPEATENARKLHAVALPAWLAAGSEGQWSIHSATTYLRSLGFRRIGHSYCLGYSFDPNHASHSIPADEDIDPPANPWTAEGEPSHLNWSLSLHLATTYLSDDMCLGFYKRFVAASSPADWKQLDRSRNNVLHVAVLKRQIKCVQWLVKDAVRGRFLRAARNMQGHTPLNLFRLQLDEIRAKLQDRFCGFDPQEVSFLTSLTYGNNPPDEGQKMCLQYGCTCLNCIHGLVSARTKAAIGDHARSLAFDMTKNVEDGPKWCDSYGYMTCHVIPCLQKKLATDRSVRLAFARLFGHIAVCMDESKIPTMRNIWPIVESAQETALLTQNYLGLGGSVNDNINAALVGLSYFAARYHTKWLESRKGLRGRQSCRNDYQFTFVALMCRNNPSERRL